ncbi:hypothetical protein K2173_015626 [Erythroxylum novogranatense]|uniref:Homeobox domain-containing protein n=1 Tax=Erythroxylum novogranatense TaxID=1862640 RepID=A0AAV8SEP7_9ROSI|nr:hypothetical protein K2173_015626 [Erythroxylum novogranatense]
METDNVDIGASSGGNANSRWSPTKEQISMLESLYGQGMRTPSADQIQQITGRLKAYGQIEGKNVFYWFQNHKARQRQKQKQENMAYINCYLHNKSHQALVAPSCPNGVCGPYYLAHSELGFYPQYCKSKVQIPGGLKRRSRTEKVDKTISYYRTTNELAAPHENTNVMLQKSDGKAEILDIYKGNINQETLPLFPLHPTGVLKGRASFTTIPSTYTKCDENSNGCVVEGSCDKPFFDFFS